MVIKDDIILRSVVILTSQMIFLWNKITNDNNFDQYFPSSLTLFEAIYNSSLQARYQIAGLVQERRNSIANALELRLSCTNQLR